MISQQDRDFLQHATEKLPKNAVLESSDPFLKQLHQMHESKKAKGGKGVTAGAHLADTGHGLKPTAGMKGVKEANEKVNEKVEPTPAEIKRAKAKKHFKKADKKD